MEKEILREKAQINKTQEIYKVKPFSFVVEDVTLPNGTKAEMAMVRHPGSTAIVPLFDDGTIAMTHQYRHAVRDYLLEIPAGTMDPGESPLTCARRELEEETGLVAKEFVELIDVHILPAYSDERIYVYLARNFTITEQHLDKDEIIQVVKYPLEVALQMIDDGRITDALTILSLRQADLYIRDENKVETGEQ